jgi:laccase
MNNASFVLPTGMSLLEAHFRNVMGVYTRDFPDRKNEIQPRRN